jgi:tRNA-specific 2-thiouridylase
VIRIDPETKRLIVGPRSALAVTARLSSISTGSAATIDPGRPLAAKVRSLAKPTGATFDGDAVHFATPEYGVAPGQAAVLYDGDRVLGGGWIETTEAACRSA